MKFGQFMSYLFYQKIQILQKKTKNLTCTMEIIFIALFELNHVLIPRFTGKSE